MLERFNCETIREIKRVLIKVSTLLPNIPIFVISDAFTQCGLYCI